MGRTSTSESRTGPSGMNHSGDDAPAAACTLTVGGMDCSSCAESVQKALRSLEGVQDAYREVSRRSGLGEIVLDVSAP